MVFAAAYAGASKRVLQRLTRNLSPLAIAVLRWMCTELRAGRRHADLPAALLLSQSVDQTEPGHE